VSPEHTPARLRILYHHRTQGRGAEGNHIVSIVTALRGLGHRVDVLSPAGLDPFDPQATVPVDKAKTETKGWSSVWKNISKHVPNWMFELGEIFYNVPAYLRVAGALRQKDYDLVFERYAFYMVGGALATKRSGCRFLLEVNEVSGIPGRARKQTFVSLCAWFERRLFKRCTIIHAVSSYLGERILAQDVSPTKLVVAPNGFDIERVRRARPRQEMRDRFDLKESIVIGFAGWFDHWDRLDFLANAFALVHREHPNTKLCLIGDGPGAVEVQKTAADLGLQDALVMTGAVARSEIYDHLQMLDIGVLPHSNVYGSPIVMFEMMGLKIPLAVPKLAPLLDVHGDGATALLFVPLDANGLVDCLMRLVESQPLRSQLAEKAFYRLNDKYTWHKTAQQILHPLFSKHAI
jgi:glycosyltransferase involved in cell wall biosynthesis